MKSFGIILLLLLVGFINPIFSQNSDFQWFDKNGKAIDSTKVFASFKQGDVVLFGEIHDNVIGHQFQLSLAQFLLQKFGNKLQFGAEMFETDNQVILDEYLNNLISEKNYSDEMRLWNNYETDYKPLVELAKQHGLLFTATNVPRRYAAMVFAKGDESLMKLSKSSKQFIAPLPMPFDPTLSKYQEMLEMMGGHADETANYNFPKAQAIKDATMAHFILKNKKKENLFLHFNGSFHSDEYQGIGWYLKKYNSKISIKTISTVVQTEVAALDKENLNVADFILVVKEDYLKSYE